MKKALWTGVVLLLGFHLLSASLEWRREKEIWRDFISKLREGRIADDDIRPHGFVSTESQLRVFNIFRTNAVWKEWEAEPEIIRQNRAEAAGWNLEIKIQGPFTILHFFSHKRE